MLVLDHKDVIIYICCRTVPTITLVHIHHHTDTFFLMMPLNKVLGDLCAGRSEAELEQSA